MELELKLEEILKKYNVNNRKREDGTDPYLENKEIFDGYKDKGKDGLLEYLQNSQNFSSSFEYFKDYEIEYELYEVFINLVNNLDDLKKYWDKISEFGGIDASVISEILLYSNPDKYPLITRRVIENINYLYNKEYRIDRIDVKQYLEITDKLLEILTKLKKYSPEANMFDINKILYDNEFKKEINLDTKELDKYIKLYKKSFSSRIPEQFFKWKGIKEVKDKWNIANVQKRLETCLDTFVEFGLFDVQSGDRKYYEDLFQAAGMYPYEVNNAFKVLLDENIGLRERIDDFLEIINDVIRRIDNSANHIDQDLFTPSLLLACYYCKKYYIFNTDKVKYVYKKLLVDSKFNAKKVCGKDYVEYIDFCEKIKEEFERKLNVEEFNKEINNELSKLILVKVNDANHMLISDFIYFMGEYIAENGDVAEADVEGVEILEVEAPVSKVKEPEKVEEPKKIEKPVIEKPKEPVVQVEPVVSKVEEPKVVEEDSIKPVKSVEEEKKEKVEVTTNEVVIPVEEIKIQETPQPVEEIEVLDEVEIPEVEEIVDTMPFKYDNLIINGVSGSGKSYYIKKRLEKFEIEEKYIRRVSFYQEYTYENFIGYYKDEKMKPVPGPFTKILKDALVDSENNYYLIIEDMNRGNVEAIFGDVLQLLDRKDGISEYGINNDFIYDYLIDNSKIKLSDEKIYIPKNLFIVATINTNIFNVDTSFSRRWNYMRFTDNESYELDVDNKYTMEKYIKGFNGVLWNSKDDKGFRNIINDSILTSNNILNKEDKLLGLFYISEKDLCENKEDALNESPEHFINNILRYLWFDVYNDKNELVKLLNKVLGVKIVLDERVSFDSLLEELNDKLKK